MGFKISLDSNIIIPANSVLTITPYFLEFVIETKYNNKIIKKKLLFTLG